MKKFKSAVVFSLILSLLMGMTAFAADQKGILYTGDEASTYDCYNAKHIAFNITLGNGWLSEDTIDYFYDNGYEITFIVTNSHKGSSNPAAAAAGYNNPIFYMIDFYGADGGTERAEFQKIVDTFGSRVTNWVIGNEISDQLYNFYNPADVRTYMTAYCNSFKDCYSMIKADNANANVLISFDQSWDMPALSSTAKQYDPVLSQYKYNTKEQLSIINELLPKNVDWGVALHPYPDPVSDCCFTDDFYAGHSETGKEGEKAYVVTINNIEIVTAFLSQEAFLNESGKVRNIMITEIAFANNRGEAEKCNYMTLGYNQIYNNPLIKAFIYNNQDAYGFKLTGESKSCYCNLPR